MNIAEQHAIRNHNYKCGANWAKLATEQESVLIGSMAMNVNNKKVHFMGENNISLDTLIEHMENLTNALKQHRAKNSGSGGLQLLKP